MTLTLKGSMHVFLITVHRALFLKCSARIFQLSDRLDIDDDFIPLFHVNRWVTEGPNPLWGAGQNDITGGKGEALGKKLQ